MKLRSIGAARATALLVVIFSIPAETKPPKDRGKASMKIGGQAWSASRASARVRGDRLTISAAWKERGSKNVRRSQTLRLVLRGYDGPGEYEADVSSSFTTIGLDTKAVEAAEGDEKATNKVVTDLLRKSQVTLLRGAKVVITSADQGEIRGTFTPARGTVGPPITDGKFRALVRKKRDRSNRRSRRSATNPDSSN